ncbi:MAG: hypothetical protein ACK5MT_07450 [Actinomycetales bacterium]
MVALSARRFIPALGRRRRLVVALLLGLAAFLTIRALTPAAASCQPIAESAAEAPIPGGSAPRSALREGELAVPLTLDEQLAGWVEPGDELVIYLASDISLPLAGDLPTAPEESGDLSHPSVLGTARVLSEPPAADAPFEALGPVSRMTVLAAVDATDAPTVAVASARGSLSAALMP